VAKGTVWSWRNRRKGTPETLHPGSGRLGAHLEESLGRLLSPIDHDLPLEPPVEFALERLDAHAEPPHLGRQFLHRRLPAEIEGAPIGRLRLGVEGPFDPQMLVVDQREQNPLHAAVTRAGPVPLEFQQVLSPGRPRQEPCRPVPAAPPARGR